MTYSSRTCSSHTCRTPRPRAPRLSAEEEAALARQWRDAKDRRALNRLVEAHRPFVISIARRLDGYRVCRDDLVCEGTLGLIRAAERFNPDRGTRLATYAAVWIKSAVYHFILRSLSIAKAAARDARKEPGRPLDPGPADEAIPGRIASWLSQSARSPGAGALFTDPVALEACIADEQNDPEIELVERGDLNRQRTLLAEAISILDERERHILLSRRIRDEPLRARDLAAHYAVSTERISQIEARAFEKVKNAVLARVGAR